ncbi:MAG: hypothetical protein ACOCP8_08610 [archaeon]
MRNFAELIIASKTDNLGLARVTAASFAAQLDFTVSEIEELKGEEIDGIFHFEGKKTKTGKKTFKYVNEKGQVKDYLPSTAKNKGYKPAKKEDL